MNLKKKLTALILALTMVLSISVFNFADVHSIIVAEANPTGFTDVPTTHWAYADIMALAKGGLVNGMGDGTFAPNSTLTIAQMAKIICAAKGLGDNASGYWATEYIRICQEDVKNLPNFGPINKANYDVPCTRELAVYMVVEGLGIHAGAKNNGKTSDDIPDWQQIDTRYDEAVVKAVQYGIITGMDDKGTFAPKQSLTRAQVCAILNRAGYTTAAPKAVNTAGLECKEIYERIKATGLFNETKDKTATGNEYYSLVAKDRKYGNLTIDYVPAADGLEISGREQIDSLIYDKDYNVLGVDGSVVSTFDENRYYDANGKALYPSAMSYESRLLVKQLLEIALGDDAGMVYNGLRECLTEPYSYTCMSKYPSKVIWASNHPVVITTSKGFIIQIDKLNDKATYDAIMARPASSTKMPYQNAAAYNGFQGVSAAFELDKW